MRCSDGRAGTLGEHFAHALDFGADTAQFFFDALVAAIDVVHAVDDCLAFSDECGENE